MNPKPKPTPQYHSSYLYLFPSPTKKKTQKLKHPDSEFVQLEEKIPTHLNLFNQNQAEYRKQ
jgi:hypothetical protein